MIRYYSFDNFYSIKDKVTVNFIVDKHGKSLSSETYREDVLGNRTSLVEMIVGANASGKTNTIMALKFIRSFILNDKDMIVNDDVRLFIKYLTFARQLDGETNFEVEFSTKAKVFVYKFTIGDHRILEESLRERSKSDIRITSKSVFTRKWNKRDKKYDYKFYGVYKNKNVVYIPKNWQPKQTVSIINSLNEISDQDGPIKDVYNYWKFRVSPLKSSRFSTESIKEELALLAKKDPDKLKSIEEQLTKLDLGFHSFHTFDTYVVQDTDQFGSLISRLKKQKGIKGIKHKKKKDCQVKHEFKKTPRFVLSLEDESSGTLMLINILIDVISILSEPEAGIAVVDELDAYLHPNLVEYLVDLFRSPDSNPYGSQLLFSSHLYTFLSELDKQQIILTEKEQSTGSTKVWRLDEVEGLKVDSNFYHKYVSGKLGAKPKI